jgi:hypothetical protein
LHNSKKIFAKQYQLFLLFALTEDCHDTPLTSEWVLKWLSV